MLCADVTCPYFPVAKGFVVIVRSVAETAADAAKGIAPKTMIAHKRTDKSFFIINSPLFPATGK